MKTNFFKMLSLALMSIAILVSCEKEVNGPKVDPKLEFDGVEQITGNLKMGVSIEVLGTNFEQDDYISIIDTDEADPELKEIGLIRSDSKKLLVIDDESMIFGIQINGAWKDKYVDLYINREGFQPFVLASGVKLVTPTVAEGYLPDANFRARLKMLKKDAETTWDLIDKYQLLDVKKANSYNGCWDEDQFKTGRLTITDMDIDDFSGIEHFKNVEEIRSWSCRTTKKADVSSLLKLKMWLAGNMVGGIVPGVMLNRFVLSDEDECEELDLSQAASLNTVGFKNTKKMYLLNLCRTKGTWAKASDEGFGKHGFLDPDGSSFSYADLSAGDTKTRVIKVNYSLIREGRWSNNFRQSLINAYQKGVKIEVYSDEDNGPQFQTNFNPNLIPFGNKTDGNPKPGLTEDEVKNNALDPNIDRN